MKVKIAIVFVVLLYVMLCISSANLGGDFDVYLNASIELWNGNNIYVFPSYNGLQYFYSPLFALILTPFSGSFFVTDLIWLLLSGFLLYRAVVLLSRYYDISVLSKKQRIIWVVIVGLFTVRFLLYNIFMIQITVFLLWAIFESIDLINKKKWLLGSFILGLVINIKLLPMVVLPYLLYRGKIKEFVAVLVMVAVFLILPSIFIGHDYNMYLLTEWWATINPLKGEFMIESDINTQSLVGIVPVFLTETKGGLDISRNFLSLSEETAIGIMNLIRLFVVGLTLLFLKSPFKKSDNKLSEIRALAYICLLIPLIFPHQQKYSFFFLLPMIMYLVYYCLLKWRYQRTARFKLFLGLLIFSCLPLLPIVGAEILGFETYELIHHFRVTGISAVLLIVFAFLAKPEILEVAQQERAKNFEQEARDSFGI